MFRLARTGPAGWLVRAGFTYGTRLLPVRRVAETDTLIAFHHPAPSWRPHILVVPKQPIPSFLAIRPERAHLFGEIVQFAFALAKTHDLYANGFAVLVNGGAYQDVPQLHVHLAGLDAGLTYTTPAIHPEDRTPLHSSTDDDDPAVSSRLPLSHEWERGAGGEGLVLVAYRHPRPQRAVHVVVQPRQPVTWHDLAGPTGARLGQELVTVGQQLVRQLGGMASGFTLLASVPTNGSGQPVCLHLVGGVRQAGG